jgi:hypothetical protein
MNSNHHAGFGILLVLFVLAAAAGSDVPRDQSFPAVRPAKLPRVGTVDERFQSYNIEMVEIVGGRFWKPYAKLARAATSATPSAKPPGATPVGMNPELFEQRPPIDLSTERLCKLAAALGPAYVRVSGTWANSIYFHDSDAPAPAAPPQGFGGVLTRKQWKGVVGFARAVDAEIVTSFATSAGTRDAAGAWTPAQARPFLEYSKSVGGRIAAAEFMNEPNIAVMGGAPKGYDAAAYARDLAVFRPFIQQAAPSMRLLGPGSVGEGTGLLSPAGSGFLRSEDLLAATGPVFNAFSYHFYGAVSQRCAGLGANQTTADAALSEEWLSRADTVDAFYAGLRDRFDPGKPLWITETADAACGGNPWGSTFLDTFRYLDQHARLARRGVQVIMHNTLASSDYGLLDENMFEPRPNYWAAWLWRQFMGTTVLDPGPAPSPHVHVYAHCLRGHPGGVALLVLNLDRTTPHSLALATPAERYTISARDLLATTVQLNGHDLKLGPDDTLPPLVGEAVTAGGLLLAPATITFLTFADAGNVACR